MNTLLINPQVTGNIGSCTVKTSQMSYDFTHDLNVMTNSCTGQVIKETIVYDPSNLGGIIFIGFFGVVAILAVLFFSLGGIIKLHEKYQDAKKEEEDSMYRRRNAGLDEENQRLRSVVDTMNKELTKLNGEKC